MTRTVFCHKLKIDAEGLTHMTYPGELGQRIYDNISRQAWKLWLEHQTRLINEGHLNLVDAKSRQFLVQEMEKFLFSDDSVSPPGYVPPTTS